MSTRRDFLALGAGAVAAATVLPIAAASAAGHPDAELVRLGERLREAWAAEQAALANSERDQTPEADRRWELLERRSSAIVGQIEQQRATTLDGLRVKELALRWCNEGEPLTAALLGFGASTDGRLILGIFGDLLAAGGA
jgi:hypothetical protein